LFYKFLFNFATSEFTKSTLYDYAKLVHKNYPKSLLRKGFAHVFTPRSTAQNFALSQKQNVSGRFPSLGISFGTSFYAFQALGFLPERVFTLSKPWDFFQSGSARRHNLWLSIQNFSKRYIFCFTF
jgi:hypothetical protein